MKSIKLKGGTFMLMKELLQKWLEQNVMPTCKTRTYARYKDIACSHIISEMGDCDVRDITSQQMRDFLILKRMSGNIKTGGELSGASVNMIRTVLKLAMQYACERGYIKDNPVLSAPRNRSKPKKVAAFTLREQMSIEKAISRSNDRRLIGIKICLYTGLRIGELLALRWSDIDLKSGVLRVDKTVYRAKGSDGEWRTVIDKPKSEASVRDIPIPTMLLNELRQAYQTRKGSTVICDKNGQAVKVRTYQAIFERLLVNNKIRVLNFHVLRHTFATRSLETKMDIKTLSEILGHESEIVTIRTYCHSFMSTKKKAINQLNKYYYNASNNIFDAKM